MEATVEQPKPDAISYETIAPITTYKPRKKRAPKHDFKDGMGKVFAHRHDHGGGWVADTAKVDEQVYIGPRAQVFNYATLCGDVRLQGRAKVFGHARIDGSGVGSSIVVKENAQVYGAAVVRDFAVISQLAHIFGNAHVSGNSAVAGAALISESAQIISSVISGASIRGRALAIASTISGATLLDTCLVHGATLRGAVEIKNHARVFSGNVYGAAPVATVVCDHATLNNSNVYYFLTISGRSLIQTCTFSRGYYTTTPSDGVSTPRLQNRTIIDRSFGSVEALQNYLRDQDNPVVAQPAVSAAPAVPAAPSRPVPPPLLPRGRRLQRLDAPEVATV
jgi:carbonic anhydrase/acetyltransferase-like protein (isoleucine patch superfamily)